MGRRVAYLVCLCMLVIGMTACKAGKTDGEAARTDLAEETVEVYYLNLLGQTAIGNMLNWYQESSTEGPEIEITVIQDMDQFEKTVDKQGLPDLILIDKQHMDLMANPYQWIEKGAAADLTSLMANDESLDISKYLGGVLEAGKADGTQYMIPLAVRSSYLLMQNDVKEKSELAELSDEATVQELLEALLKEYEKHAEESEYWTELRQFYTMGADQTMALYELMEQIGALQIDRNQKTVTVDKDLVELAIRYMRYQQAEANEAMEQLAFWQQGYETVSQACTAFTSNGNAAFSLYYMGSASEEICEKTMEIMPFPIQQTQNEYAVCVTMVGMIGAQSENQEAAYQVLRTLMDIPAEEWWSIFGGESLKETPVCRQTAYDLVERFACEAGGKFSVYGDTVEQQPLSEKQVQQLKAMLDGIQKAYITDYEIYIRLGRDLASVWVDEDADIKGYADLLQIEIKEYLDQ